MSNNKVSLPRIWGKNLIFSRNPNLRTDKQGFGDRSQLEMKNPKS
jgi:hypothetical protein